MMRTAVFPGRYVQGPGALSQLGTEAARFAARVLVFADEGLPTEVTGAVGGDGVDMVMKSVQAACTEQTIADAAAAAKSMGADAIAAMGGGKVIDLGRSAADDLKIPFISVPTVAASDAPCSSLSVVYDDHGAVLYDRFVRSNPRLVVVDSTVIAKAPARFFAAGIGDALATYYEAAVCAAAQASNCCGGLQTRLAMAAAETCRDTVLSLGAKALADCREGRVTPEFEAVLEANILLSGIGFESGGVAAAHAIHHGLADLHETHGALHGEKVAFGVLVELALNNKDDTDIIEIARFNRTVGLPVTLANLGISDIEAAIPKVVVRATRAGEIIYHEPMEITADLVEAAIRRANLIGQKVEKEMI